MHNVVMCAIVKLFSVVYLVAISHDGGEYKTTCNVIKYRVTK